MLSRNKCTLGHQKFPSSKQENECMLELNEDAKHICCSFAYGTSQIRNIR